MITICAEYAIHNLISKVARKLCSLGDEKHNFLPIFDLLRYHKCHFRNIKSKNDLINYESLQSVIDSITRTHGYLMITLTYVIRDYIDIHKKGEYYARLGSGLFRGRC